MTYFAHIRVKNDVLIDNNIMRGFYKCTHLFLLLSLN